MIHLNSILKTNVLIDLGPYIENQSLCLIYVLILPKESSKTYLKFFDALWTYVNLTKFIQVDKKYNINILVLVSAKENLEYFVVLLKLKAKNDDKSNVSSN